MKRFLSLTLCLAMVASAGTAFAAKGTVERDSNDQREHFADEKYSNVFTSTSSSSTMLLREQAGPDTFALLGGPGALSGKFSDVNNVIPDRQGWIGVDDTDAPVFWQVSDFNAANLGGNGAGNNAYWSGRSAAQEPGWVAAPGYGNNWNDIAIYESAVVANQAAGQTVTLNFVFNHDSEPGYDNFNVEYDSAGTWTNVLSIDGTNKAAGVFAAPGVSFASVATGAITYAGGDYSTDGRIKIRFRFSSDGGWSDSDGLFPSDGGVQLDDITISHSEGNFSEGFEGAAPFLVKPDKSPFAGDFSAVYARITDLDICRENTTPLIGFIDFGQAPPNGPGVDGTVSTGGSVSPNWQYGIPGSWVTNYTGGLSNGEVPLANYIVSPELDWDLPGTADDGADVSGVRLSWSLWRHLPLNNAMFYRWSVRSQTAGNPWGTWQNSPFVYYGSPLGDWLNPANDITSRVAQNPVKVQVRFAALDLAAAFGFPGGDGTPSPVYDNVRLIKYRIGGAAMTTRDIDIAQSGFPTNGSIAAASQAERDALDIPFDMAQDVNGAGTVNIAGDSVTVNVVAVIPGSSISDIRMKWALRKNPFFEDAIRQAPARAKDVNVSAVGPIWTGEVLADTSKTTSGAPIANRFFADLPDVDFLYPGDQLHYYFETTDSDSRVTTLPGNTAGFGVWNTDGVSTYNRVWTVRGLPTITAAGTQPRKLIYNDAFDRGDNNELLSMMGQLGFTEGVDYDQYDVQGPSSGVANGIGSAGVHGATPDQLEGYDTIIINWASLASYLLSDGSDVNLNDKGNDVGTLEGWKNLPNRQRNTVYFGDFVAFGLTATEGSPASAAYLETVMGVQFNDRDARDEIGFQTAPRVQGLLPAFDTDFVAFGGCIAINEFDSISPRAGAVAGHAWLSPGGTPYANPAASVVFDRVVGLDRKVDITFPFGLGFVWSDNSIAGSGLGARTDLMSDIFTYLSVPASGPNVTSAPQVRKAELSIVPNPFNPKTTVKFALPARGEATVKVFNLRGELVRTLHSGVLDAGEHPFVWNGTDNDGRSVSSGVYLVNAITEGFNGTKKAVLVK